MAQMSMAELMAKQDFKSLTLSRGQEVLGTIVEILPHEIILDLGTKSEGILPKKDLPQNQVENLKIGDKLSTFVIHPENESGQVVLGLNRITKKGATSSNIKFNKFEEAQKNNQVLTGRGLEVNKGGLIVEVAGMRGFLPSSQVSLSQAANLDELVGKDITVTVIEVDSAQNRLIFSQKTSVSEDIKQKLNQLKIGDNVSGTVAAVLPFGIFVTLPDHVEGLVHISEISWEKVEDPATLFKNGDNVEAKVTSIDSNTGRVNLSIKQLSGDPFTDKVKQLQPDDVIKATVTKVSSMGVSVKLEEDIEGFIPASKLKDVDYKIGAAITCLVDNIDSQKRRVNLAPFITSTKDLIYK